MEFFVLSSVMLNSIRISLSTIRSLFKKKSFITLLIGCCPDVPEYPFDEQYDSFAFNSLLTLPESIQAMGKVRTECNRVSCMSLFHIPTAKPMRLEEFEQTQSQATTQVIFFFSLLIHLSCFFSSCSSFLHI